MDTPHFDAAVSAFTTALAGRVSPSIASFPDLFRDDATIVVPFDGSGDGAPIVGKPAIEQMTRDLAGFLWFEHVTFDSVLPTHDVNVVVCEYQAVLRRADMPGRQRRRYISIITLHEGRISTLREHGGPFMPIE
ncbi:hypothetical protein [Curtobacterium sp. MCSS17_016]|uniref:nuclear transport factor 2 family protein n=1 Tax=Curtobacterium sp. MCSS17_016 TaxID=2175644 RepID=UPI000DA857E7|nr:hypothetical protein [Curtobacterium sp. MCSS17_016]WIE80209.1 hypothetical protein DEJ19_006465 [Curtobacterium sp. MCSS17_016]